MFSALVLTAATIAYAEPVSGDGKELFARNCAACHDADGRASSALAQRLRPRPRDFGEGLFQLASTDDGRPTEDDLARVVHKGIPGSGMPSFGHLSTDEVATLVHEVQRLTLDGVAGRVKEDARYFGEELDDELAHRFARSALAVEPLPPLPPFPAANEATLAVGRELYVVHCAACHGFDGRGRGALPAWSDSEFPLARDLTRGPLKGGTTLEDVARRIRAGMPGRGMPPTRLAPEQNAALTVYVASLFPADIATRYEQRRERVVARRVPAVASAANAAEWDSCAARRLVLTPLSGRADAVLEASIAAMHDGREIAFRIVFADPTRDDRALAKARLPDACAMQFAAGGDPPLFGMGSAHHPTTLWHWRAFRADRIAGLFDLLSTPTDTMPPLPAGLLEPEKSASESEAAGPESAGAQATPGAVAVDARWTDGTWRIVFRRALTAGAERDGAPDFAPGGSLACAIAIWNGSAGDHRERKSISIWNDLILEP